ncbi:MAG: hypothetical protein QXK37_02960 [Candidatus Woesearchaeota archaeon]
MTFESVLSGLKSLKVQGAENVAKTAVDAMYKLLHSSKAHTAKELLKELRQAEALLLETRPTEPCMRNALSYILKDIPQDDLVLATRKLIVNIKQVKSHFDYAHERIVDYGARKISNEQVIFTHCHSSTVVAILIRAKREGKKFEVHNTETRPLYQGRITAKELSDAGIKVTHYIDSAARQALKKADLCLFGADAIQSDGFVINKIGTELYAEIAKGYDIPTFFCTDSWKFDPKSLYGIDERIEKRAAGEVWEHPPKNVKILNPAFERVHASLVTGIISELGVYRPSAFVEEVKRAYPWLN